MFDLRQPCVNCPFRKGQGELFRLPKDRIMKIVNGPAFQCHKTVDYDNYDDERARQGDRPQQCAGLMAMLHREGAHNQIMQVAERLTGFDPDSLDPKREAYESLAEALAAHSGEDVA